MSIKMLNPTCDQCHKSSQMIAEFAHVYRLMEIKNGRPNPGNLCGQCAGRLTAARLIDEGIIGSNLKKEITTIH